MLEIIKGIAETVLKNPRVQNGMIDAAKKFWNWKTYECPYCKNNMDSTQPTGSVVKCKSCGRQFRLG